MTEPLMYNGASVLHVANSNETSIATLSGGALLTCACWVSISASLDFVD